MKKLLLSPVALRFSAIVFLLALAALAIPQTAPVAIPSVKIGLEGAKNQGELGSSLQILALLTVLSIAPAILILTTSFTRIVIILSLTRTALGTQSIPPNQVIIGLSLFLSLYVMSPTYTEINDTALKPYTAKQITFDQAVEKAQMPLRKFMLKNTYSKDLKLFVDLRKEKATPKDVSLITLIPAFILSELKTAFIVGFYIFIPFVIIDLVVASVLMSLGMMMMPPSVVSLPAKLLVFVLADGWSLIVSAIMAGYM
ncbi:MAG: flagellar type III secretion system pore protein FliP [Armatimonadetes bacterium]|nr:flagellar type III secretion system pore protein FliP [Armatimonadota bacterium]